MSAAEMLDEKPRLALLGTPNCGKSALFNALTGLQQKVANYPGVTVEYRIGHTDQVTVIDLPGTYSLEAASPDEAVSRSVILGDHDSAAPPDAVLLVVDATRLRSQLRFVLEVKALGRPVIVALNMMDLARRDGLEIDVAALGRELGVPVIPTVAVRKSGVSELADQLPELIEAVRAVHETAPPVTHHPRALQTEARRIAQAVIGGEGTVQKISRGLDAVLLNPLAGLPILALVMFAMFQAVFAWAEAPMNAIDAGIGALQGLSDGIGIGWLRSLVQDGILAGVGSVVIFLPQILILFAFIIVLEQSGYMARAAFLMDRVMAAVGLNGRAFIPLLSSFACAIPGIMATRAIPDARDRLTTILIAPLMTCSARLPVYTLIIAAFIPNHALLPGVGLQGVVMFTLYLAGILSALIVAFVLRRTVARGASLPFMMVMPKYQWPRPGALLVGLWNRGTVFLKRAGTIIFVAMVLLWLLASYPPAPAGAEGPAILYSFAGTLGRLLEILFAPIGFTWEMCIALIPGLAAREVVVAALGTVYALQGNEDQVAQSLVATLQGAWSLPTALAFLAWYVFAPQCLATIAVAKRETNSWRWAGFMLGYLFVLAYLAAGATYWIATAMTAPSPA